MIDRRRFSFSVVAAAVISLAATTLTGGVGPAAAAPTGPAAPASRAASTDYLVLFKGTKADAAGLAAIKRAGGQVTERNDKLGYAFVRSDRAGFAQSMAASHAVEGTARNRVIGRDPQLRRAPAAEIEQMTAEKKGLSGRATSDAPAAKASAAAITPEPLANYQWDMRQIGATATGSYAVNQGSKKVRVGVIDTGIDGSHPDIAPNFNKNLSRNFVTDMPDIDGPCEYASCVDPVDEDDDGHGTHVASTIGSPINGLGIAGVAPNVTLINIRAGQDSGYFFLQATLDALTYAGDIGVDVVNMSFYTDPWLFNCTDNPADSPAEQAEQRTVRRATQRALNYAMYRGVLPVAAEGNESTDLNNPTSDDTSPDYPVDAPKDRTIDNSCITVPTESKGVVAVSSTGPSKRLAYYSNYGTEQTDVAAPGGDAYDTTTNVRDLTGAVLAAYPAKLAQLNGDLNSDGTPNTPAVVRDCKGDVCGYYQYLQGTSMASPHAVGVAALAISRLGRADRLNPGLTLPVAKSRAALYASAQPTACPQPRTYTWTRILTTGQTVTSQATCAGGIKKNGFYGRGIVNAYAAAGGSTS